MKYLNARIIAALVAITVVLCGCVGGHAASEAAGEVPPSEQKRLPVPYTDTWAAAPQAAPLPGASGSSTVSTLLASAGRNPDKAQPEKNFVVQAPQMVAVGRPFLVRVGYKGLRGARVEWHGRILDLKPNASGVCEALLAEPLKKEADHRTLTITLIGPQKTETMRADLTVVEPDYPVQSLKVNPKYVNPPKSELARIKRNQQAVRNAVSKVSTQKYWTLPLHRPVPGHVTSLYGLRRVFNGEDKGRHRGVDYNGKTGSPIGAVETGIVVLAESQYYGGKTVIIDHGLGVFSMYLHLSAIKVKEGRKVKRGDTIGLIGATGRVTGPHLHLSLYVAGDSVDAAPLLE